MSKTTIREKAHSICQAKVLLQCEDGSEFIMRVANHALKSALERFGETHEDGEHIHG